MEKLKHSDWEDLDLPGFTTEVYVISLITRYKVIEHINYWI